MHTLRSVILAIVLLLSFSFEASAHVVLLFPLGGESFNPGSDVAIQWRRDQEHNQRGWNLYYSPDGGQTWQTIRLNIPEGQFTYDWTVPKTSQSTTNGRIRVVMDNVGMNYEDESFDFTIQAVVTDIEDAISTPERSAQITNYPNPFSSQTVIEYSIGRTGHVSLEVFDLLGRNVAFLVDENLTAGIYRASWNPDNLPGGMYITRLTSGNEVRTGKVLFLK